MTSLATSFGALRSIIQQPPSVISWHRLCDMIDAWPDPEHLQHVALPYAQDILDRTWPDVMRQAPLGWLMHLMRGEEHIPGFELIRRIGRTQTIIGREPCVEIFPFAKSKDICRVLTHPQMRHITQLNLRNLHAHSDEIVEALAHTRAFERLTFLNLGGNTCSSESLLKLWANPMLNNLEQLEMWQTSMGDEDLRALAKSPHMSSLRYLELADTHVTSQGLRALFQSPHITALRELFLSDTYIGDQGIEVITEASSAAQLTILEVQRCNISSEGAKALASCATLSNLKTLYIWDNPLGDEGIAHIIKSPHLHNLEMLAIGDTNMSEDMWVEHAKDIELPNLKDLTMGSRDTISTEGLIALTQTTRLSALTKLNMSSVAFNAPAIKALSKAQWLPQLKELELCERAGTSKASFSKMLSSEHFEHLELLSLGRLKLRPKALQCIANNPSMSGLRTLQILSERNLTGGFAHIFCSEVFALRHLDLWECNIEAEDLLAMAHPNMLHMRTLELSQCTLPNKAFQTMIQSPYMANLIELHLENCDLNAQSIQAIANSEALKGLRLLNLGAFLDKKHTQMLAHSEHLHQDVRAVFIQRLRR